jgi:cytochrome b subunit of formate dehydrogenase
MCRLLVAAACSCVLYGGSAAAAPVDCLGCHEDAKLKTKAGRAAGVDPAALKASVHAKVGCVDCHDQPGNYDDTPHFTAYRKVKCAKCHGEAALTFTESFHGRAADRGVAHVPTCTTCHRRGRDDHSIVKLEAANTENACRSCHQQQTKPYDTSVHAAAAAAGKHSPGCAGCHPTHSRAMPPSTGAVEAVCTKCHKEAMKEPGAGPHTKPGAQHVACTSCHDVHATQKPAKDVAALKACVKCHPKVPEQFKGSVHAEVFDPQAIDCLACHKAHFLRKTTEPKEFGCGTCHPDAEKAYRKSAHRQARLRGNRVAALCGDCHGGHNVIPVKDPRSPMNRKHVPERCGTCHTNKGVVTEDYVRLPSSLTSYDNSVHGVGWKAGKATAVCTDCHGWHDMEVSSSPTSAISKQNLARTCGQCHKKEAAQYVDSVHGRAVAHGIKDSPTCTNCHEEHRILRVADPKSPVNPANLSARVCASCHQSAEMGAKYGLPPEVIQSYDDSYHGWALRRGDKKVAVCVDCHGIHDIGSALDPRSAIAKGNVVATCAKCHPEANATFAASYTHLSARGKRMPHDIARIIYVWLLALILGGMVVHNLLIYVFDLRAHYRAQRREPAVQRMKVVDVWLHIALLITFFSLALSGFALRFPNTWWAAALQKVGLTEEARRVFHRAMAVSMVVTSVLHVAQLLLTRRGHLYVRAMLPRFADVTDALATVKHYLGWSPKEPSYDAFDYTQKAEYWALVWGTAVMTLTGFVLWFPTLATKHFPAWVVRVCETIHFYEAILAVSAIFIWHLFFVVFKRGTYPMSWTWITGRMPLSEWEHHHGRAAKDPRVGALAPPAPGGDEPPTGSDQAA